MDSSRMDEVWIAMADHFLDTETRQDIPLTAYRCVEAGLSVEEARRVWTEEVSPVVGGNLFQVAGEWAAWDRGWLLGELRKRRSEPKRRQAWLRFRPSLLLMRGVWTSVARCMELIRAAETPEKRELLLRDLSFLAAHLFDFCPRPLAASDRDRIRALYPCPFLKALGPALVSGEALAADRRVRGVMAG